jgi:hypothetical protein
MHAPPTYLLDCYPMFPEAAHLADLQGIDHDLQTALSCCAFLDQQTGKNRRDLVTWDAVGSHAVIQYARCFAKGGRGSLQHHLLAAAPEELARAHEFFIDLRNKHIAHSVNCFEENTVVVRLQMEGREPQSVDSV